MGGTAREEGGSEQGDCSVLREQLQTQETDTEAT